MQLEATDWSIRPTLVVHPQGFTPRPVQLSMAVDMDRPPPRPRDLGTAGGIGLHPEKWDGQEPVRYRSRIVVQPPGDHWSREALNKTSDWL